MAKKIAVVKKDNTLQEIINLNDYYQKTDTVANAIYSLQAGKATADGNGKNIASTYLPKSERLMFKYTLKVSSSNKLPLQDANGQNITISRTGEMLLFVNTPGTGSNTGYFAYLRNPSNGWSVEPLFRKIGGSNEANVEIIDGVPYLTTWHESNYNLNVVCLYNDEGANTSNHYAFSWFLLMNEMRTKLATSSTTGLMSSTDKARLDSIYNLWLADGTSDTLVNKVEEVLKAFENFPEASNLFNLLGSKLDKTGGTVSGDLTVSGSIKEGNTYLSDKFSIVGHTHSNYLSNITKSQVESVLTGNITSHSHDASSIIKSATFNQAGGISALNQTLFNRARGNRFAFIPAQCITIEMSTDAGQTWSAHTTNSDANKINLFNGIGKSFTIPNTTTDTNGRLRITVDAWGVNGTSNSFYFSGWTNTYMWVSTNGASGLTLDIEKATIGTPDTWTSHRANISLGGYSGPNDIMHSSITLGGSSTQTTQSRKVRFTFRVTGFGGTSLAYISHINAYATSLHTSPSKLAESDHLYSWDYQQNAIFPAQVKIPSKTTVPTNDGTILASEKQVYDVKAIADNAVPKTRTINSKPLSEDISLTYLDVGAQAPLVSGENIKTINGTSILGSGDLSITIPTTTKQTNWDTAYGWGNHASVGYFSPNNPQTFVLEAGKATSDKNGVDIADNYVRKTKDISNTNLNTLYASGFYHGTTLTNAPTTGWYYVVVEQYTTAVSGGNSWCKQTATSFGSGNTGNLTYTRTFESGTWKPWKRLVTQDDKLASPQALYFLGTNEIDNVAYDGGAVKSVKFVGATVTDNTENNQAIVTIPTVNNATLTIQKNGAVVGTFTSNASSDKTINITVPTQASDIGASPINHASSDGKYGVASENTYGHTRIINNTTQSSHVEGTALSAYQGYLLDQTLKAKADKNSPTFTGVAKFGRIKIANTEIIQEDAINYSQYLPQKSGTFALIEDINTQNLNKTVRVINYTNYDYHERTSNWEYFSYEFGYVTNECLIFDFRNFISTEPSGFINIDIFTSTMTNSDVYVLLPSYTQNGYTRNKQYYISCFAMENRIVNYPKQTIGVDRYFGFETSSYYVGLLNSNTNYIGYYTESLSHPFGIKFEARSSQLTTISQASAIEMNADVIALHPSEM